MDFESEDDTDVDENGYSSFSELDSQSDDEPIGIAATQKDVFLDEETAFDDESNVEVEVNRLNKKWSNVVTREYKNLLQLSSDAMG